MEQSAPQNDTFIIQSVENITLTAFIATGAKQAVLGNI